jgi:hypothetical protein
MEVNMKLYHIYIETNKKDLLCINKQGNTPEIAEMSAYLELQRTQKVDGYKTLCIIPETKHTSKWVQLFERKLA